MMMIFEMKIEQGERDWKFGLVTLGEEGREESASRPRPPRRNKSAREDVQTLASRNGRARCVQCRRVSWRAVQMTLTFCFERQEYKPAWELEDGQTKYHQPQQLDISTPSPQEM